jgi:predicted component of type VI protein secretion system
MSDERNDPVDLLTQLVDELGLQAWLAGAELRNPSLQHPETREEVDALALARDELRLQLHLGRLEARAEFEQLEGRWRQLKQLAARTADDAEEKVHDVLRQIRDGYRKLSPKG